MKTYEINIDGQDDDPIAVVVRRWFAGWSPGGKPWNGDHFRDVFRTDAGAIEVLDDIGSEFVRLDSVDAYASTWTPFMRSFSYWSIKPIGPVVVHRGDEVAVVTLSFEADGRDAEGRQLLPKPGQHGTLALARGRQGWRVFREHLSTFQQPETSPTEVD